MNVRIIMFNLKHLLDKFMWASSREIRASDNIFRRLFNRRIVYDRYLEIK